nr:MAG TPA: hypothetical protein [Caudoviricetes sp.]
MLGLQQAVEVAVHVLEAVGDHGGLQSVVCGGRCSLAT